MCCTVGLLFCLPFSSGSAEERVRSTILVGRSLLPGEIGYDLDPSWMDSYDHTPKENIISPLVHL